jgi:hypothetical protein
MGGVIVLLCRAVSGLNTGTRKGCYAPRPVLMSHMPIDSRRQERGKTRLNATSSQRHSGMALAPFSTQMET